MRNYTNILFGLFVLIFFTACSASSENHVEPKGKLIDVSIDDAYYVLSKASDSNESNLLKLDLLVKNITDSSVDMLPDKQIRLYDGDNQIDPLRESNAEIDLMPYASGNIASKKQKVFSVMFEVEQDKVYELAIVPNLVDKDVEEIILELDTKDYAKSLEQIDEPKEALQAYIETIYLAKNNKKFDKLVAVDKEKIEKEAIENFEKNLNFWLVHHTVDEDKVKPYYESYQEASAEKAEIDIKVLANSGELAVVQLEYEAIPYEEIYDKMKIYRDKYRDNNESIYDREAEAKYILSKFDTILEEVSTQKASRNLEVYMKKDDDKWRIDNSRIETTNRIMKIFTEGFVM